MDCLEIDIEALFIVIHLITVIGLDCVNTWHRSDRRAALAAVSRCRCPKIHGADAVSLLVVCNPACAALRIGRQWHTRKATQLSRLRCPACPKKWSTCDRSSDRTKARTSAGPEAPRPKNTSIPAIICASVLITTVCRDQTVRLRLASADYDWFGWVSYDYFCRRQS